MSKNTKRSANRFQLFMYGLLTLYMTFFAGYHLNAHQYSSMGLALLLAFFAGGLFAITLREQTDFIREDLSDAAKGELDKVFAEATEIAKKMISDLAGSTPSMAGSKEVDAPALDHDDILMEALSDIMGEVVGDKMPTVDQTEQVTRIFTERTSHHVKLHPEEGGFAAEFSHAAFSPTVLKDDGKAVPRRRSTKAGTKDIPAKRKRVISAAQKERNNAARRQKRLDAKNGVTHIKKKK